MDLQLASKLTVKTDGGHYLCHFQKCILLAVIFIHETVMETGASVYARCFTFIKRCSPR